MTNGKQYRPWSNYSFPQSDPGYHVLHISFVRKAGVLAVLMFCSHLAKENPITYIKYILNGSNPDGSFTVDDSNSFFSPYKIISIAQENK